MENTENTDDLKITGATAGGTETESVTENTNETGSVASEANAEPATAETAGASEENGADEAGETETLVEADGAAKKKKSPLKIAVTAIICVVCAFALLLVALGACEKLAYASFYTRARIEFAIPGTDGGFVGQGLDYIEENDAYITCGYSSKKGAASTAYYINSDGKATKTELKNADGTPYTGHTGGIAHYKEYFYITGDDGCDVFALADLTEGKSESKKLGEVKTFIDPAYCNVHGGKFYTGSFYRAKNYETPDWQRMTTPAGDSNESVITVFDLDDGARDTFYVSPDPVAVYSTPALVQGMTFTEDKTVLSTSYGLAASHLYFYDNSSISSGQITLNGKTLPLYYLDGACLTSTVKAPPMSEEIVYKDGRIYIMTESASNKYIFGKFTGAGNLYSYAI